MLFFILYLREVSKYKPQGGLYSDRRFNGGFLALRFWRGLHKKDNIFEIFRYFHYIADHRSLCLFVSTEQVSNPLTPGVTSFSLHMKVRRLPWMCKRVRNAREHCVPPVTATESFICLSSFFIFSASKRSLNILLIRSTLFLTLKTTFRASLRTFLKCFQGLRGSHFEGNPIRILRESPVLIIVN